MRNTQWISVGFLILTSVSSAAVELGGPNVRVNTIDLFPGGPFQSVVGDPAEVLNQTGPSIAVDPLVSNRIAVGFSDVRMLEVASPDFRRFRWPGIAFSSTEGSAFQQEMLIPGFPGDTSPAGMASPVRGNKLGGDPSPDFDLFGNLYSGFFAGTFDPPPLPPGVIPQIGVARYHMNSSGDLVFDKIVTVRQGSTQDSSRVLDFAQLTVDNSIVSPFFGAVYTSWNERNIDASTGTITVRVALARSDDHGESYVLLDTSSPEFDEQFYARITTDPCGNLYVVTITDPDPATGLSLVNIAVSEDGGATFRHSTVAEAFLFVQSSSPESFRVLSMPSLAADEAGVYVAYSDRSSISGGDIKVSRSTDSGLTWDAPVVPHSSVLAHQFYPAVAARGGKLSVIWYDSRSEPAFDPDGLITGQCPSGNVDGAGCTGVDVFYNQASTLVDGPLAFETETRVSSTSFNGNLRTDDLALEGSLGNLVGLAANLTTAYAAWGDNRDVNPTANALEDDDLTTQPPELINIRSRDSNVYFQKIRK